MAAKPDRLKRRGDFLRAARARRQGTPAIMVQGRKRGPDGRVRFGVTASRKIGGAVQRNRAKRRMRALAREVIPGAGQPGWDYVLIARPKETLRRPYAAMCREVAKAIARLHDAQG